MLSRPLPPTGSRWYRTLSQLAPLPPPRPLSARRSLATSALGPTPLATARHPVQAFQTARPLSITTVNRLAATTVHSSALDIFGMASSSDYPKPPQPPPEWNHTPNQIVELVEQAIAKSTAVMDKIGALKEEECDFESVVLALAKDDADMQIGEILTFYQYVSVDETLRNAAVEATKKLEDYDINCTARLDVYHSLLAAQKNISSGKLDPESQRLLDKLILQRKRNGLGLDEQKRKRFGDIKKEISGLQVDFSKNFNEEKGVIWFTKEELEGVPDDALSGFKEENGKLAMDFKTPSYGPVMKYAKNPETRKCAFLGYESRLSVNEPILKQILSLRREAASVLGYPTWADYILEVKMAKTKDTVTEFLDDLEKKLKPIAEKERDKLLVLKKEEVEKRGWKDDASKFYIWDYRYYDNLYTERTLDLREDEVKQYFPVEKVVTIILDIYQSLLGVKFFRVPDAKVWHEEASQWAVWDSEGLAKGGTEGFLGYMHLDLYPREGKYSHAAVWGLRAGYEAPDGPNGRSYPVAAMVANLAKPTPGKPALLTHDSVVTFFHEMGHAFHQLCSKTKYARFHGTSVARDFVEAPSQMLENWCWTSAELKRMSTHYKNEGEPLPAELIEKIIKSRNVNSGLFNVRQIFFGKYDMAVHTSDKDLDLTKLWCDMRKDVSLVEFDGEYAPGQSSFGHITGGYYGYNYSLSFSADMFATVFKSDPMSPKSGALYRKEILQPGGSREEMDSLVAFLGREPNNEAFMKQLLGE